MMSVSHFRDAQKKKYHTKKRKLGELYFELGQLTFRLDNFVIIMMVVQTNNIIYAETETWQINKTND